MNLKEPFDLKDYTQSPTAAKQGFNEQYIPGDQVVDRLEDLHKNIVRPLAEYLPGVLSITSGYRCPRLNAHIKGSPKSQHTFGMAVDLEYRENGIELNNIIIEAVKRLNLTYDQMIKEFPDAKGNPKWVHLSYNAGHNRMMYFTIS